MALDEHFGDGRVAVEVAVDLEWRVKTHQIGGTARLHNIFTFCVNLRNLTQEWNIVFVHLRFASIVVQNRFLGLFSLKSLCDHVPKHDGIVAEPQGLAAGRGHILDNHLAGFDVGKLFDEGCVLVSRIEVPDDGGSVVGIGRIGVFDAQLVDRDALGHVGRVAISVLTVVFS